MTEHNEFYKEQIEPILLGIIGTNFLEDDELLKSLGVDGIQFVDVSRRAVNSILEYIQSGKDPNMKYLDKDGLAAIFMFGMILGSRLHEKTTA